MWAKTLRLSIGKRLKLSFKHKATHHKIGQKARVAQYCYDEQSHMSSKAGAIVCWCYMCSDAAIIGDNPAIKEGAARPPKKDPTVLFTNSNRELLCRGIKTTGCLCLRDIRHNEPNKPGRLIISNQRWGGGRGGRGGDKEIQRKTVSVLCDTHNSYSRANGALTLLNTMGLTHSFL